jgi:hypothetical protein
MNPFFIGIPAFAACVFFGYLLREFAVGKLSAEQLGCLDKGLRPYRIRYVISTVALLLVFITVRYSVPRLATEWFETTLSLLAIATVGFEFVGWRTSALTGLTSSFKVPYLASRILSIGGILCLLVTMAATPFVDFKAHPVH